MTLGIAFNVHDKLTPEHDLKHFAFVTKQIGSASASTSFDYEMTEPANFASVKCFFVVDPGTGARTHWHQAILDYVIKVKTNSKLKHSVDWVPTKSKVVDVNNFP